MANKCMLISAVPRVYKEWYIATRQKLEEAGKPASNDMLEKMWLDHITSKDTSGMMEYITHEDRGARTAIQFGKSNPKETLILGVKDNGDGSVTVATLDGVYTFTNGSSVSSTTYRGNNVTLPMMEDIQRQVEQNFSNFNIPFNVLSRSANEWASKYMLIGLADKSGKVIGPLIRKAHLEAKKKSNLYRDTVNLVSDGYRDSVFLSKMRVMLKTTGDINWKDVNVAQSIAYENARRTKEVLDTDLPKFDKWISREIRDEKERAKIDQIFGRNGFMHLMENTEIMSSINTGDKSLDELINMIPHTPAQMNEAIELKNYMVSGKVPKNGSVNSKGSKSIEQLAALLSLKENGKWDTLVSLRSRHPELFVEILRITGMVKSLDEVAYKGKQNSVGKGSGKVYTGQDIYSTLDIYEGLHEYAYVTKSDMNKYLKDPRWKVIKEPDDVNIGILSRESMGSYQEGIGLDKSAIRNGISIDTTYVDDMVKKHGKDWITDNNIVSDADSGYIRYRIILTEDQKIKNGLKQNLAHTMYRTWVHNAQLVEMQTVQNIVMERMIEVGEAGIEDLEKRIIRNDKVDADKRQELKPFIQSDLTYEEIRTKYPEVYKRYTPVRNISEYGNMRDKVKYVRKDMEDVLVGYPQGSLIKDDTTLGITLQRVETVYKQLVQMIKLKLVVANPAKLAVDMVSNTTMLLAMDVGIDEIAKKYPESVKFATEMSELEGKLVSARIDLAKAEAMKEDTVRLQKRVDSLLKEIKEHPFYAAVRNGFVQSHGTSMMIKEFDTISGLQKNIDKVVGYIMKDSKGNTTKAHEAVVWMMNVGFSLDDILDSVANMSRVKGTSVGKELEGIAERLAEKKGTDVIRSEEKKLGRKLTEDEVREIHKDADTVRYVSEFIAAPTSELVRQGSRAMQMADLMGRWTLYQHELVKRLKESGYTYESEKKALADIANGKLDEAVWEKIESDSAMYALDMFIDNRINMPQEIKALSDYGILMFPGFWIRAQKVIANLVLHHPLNAGTGLLVTDLLGIKGGSIVDANILSKISNGSIVHAGQNIFDPSVIILGL